MRHVDLLGGLFDSARRHLRKVVLPEGDDARVLAAASRLRNEKIAVPVLLGSEEVIAQRAVQAELDVKGLEIIDPHRAAGLESYAAAFAMVAGAANPTRRVIEAGLMTVGLADGIALPSSFFLMMVPDFLGRGPKTLIFADCAVNADPTVEELADI